MSDLKPALLALLDDPLEGVTEAQARQAMVLNYGLPVEELLRQMIVDSLEAVKSGRFARPCDSNN